MSGESPTVSMRLADLGADLATIEVNTIVKSCITGDKMPQAEHALIDIAAKMWLFLIEARAVPQKTDQQWDQDVHAGWAAWDACRKAARAALAASSVPEAPDLRLAHDVRMGKLDRIASACDQLKGLLYDTSKVGGARAGSSESTCGLDCRISRNNTGAVTHTHNEVNVTYAALHGETERRRWIPIDHRQRALLRKIWEVGLEEIALQTVIQLDGDIVTRVHPAYLHHGRLFEIHHESVHASQTFWKELIDIALRLIEALAGKR